MKTSAKHFGRAVGP